LLPFSDACERNKHPILAVLKGHLAPSARVLEIGAGTGQHAVHFARHLPAVTWQPSDRDEYLPGLRARVAEEGTPNLLWPVELDVEHPGDWPPPGAVDAVFSANTLHIMSWPAVEALFCGVGQLLQAVPSALLMVYGPFRYRGRCTSDSNEAFDLMLRERDPASGIRDFEAVDTLAGRQGFVLARDQAMPANNQLVVWRR
jgi:cyclopropane fatty-acyl-phospholipid synthase-like methyltransferase